MFSSPPLQDIRTLASPTLVLDADIFEANLRQMIEIAGRPDRLRPHCKTHKMAEVARRELAVGVVKHKAATIAEVEMLAREGATDVLLAYPVVGPQIQRILALKSAYPTLKLKVLVDDQGPASAISAAAERAKMTIDVMVDLDVGQHRTGAAPENWLSLCQQVVGLPGLRLVGLHVYDGHNNAAASEVRQAEVDRIWKLVKQLLADLSECRLTVDEVTVGGTGSFPCWAKLADPRIILSPGTVVFYDAGYASRYHDLPFRPAIWLLSRVISRPQSGKITLDAGYKAVSGDPPLEKRAIFPQIGDAKIVAQNEEHLVLETARASELSPGTEIWLIPWHVCPTVALQSQVVVAKEGKIVEEWSVSARDRVLSI